MAVALADTFTRSLADLDRAHHTPVKVTLVDFLMQPAGRSAKLHRLEKSRDPNLWSIRVNRDIRIILHHSAEDYLMCYVDHHDKAYRWAETRELTRHPATGALQLLDVEEVRRVIEVPVHQEARVFDPYSDDYLLALGVPPEWLPAVRTVGASGVDQLLPRLPAEAAESLLRLYLGELVPLPVETGGSGLDHPESSRRFRIIDNEEDLRRALEAPWEKWLVFLHPAQRDAVERDWSGPALVTGSAGTGKTVVALHRAARLARSHPGAKVLLTSYSRTLAAKLERHLALLLGEAPTASLTVTHLHKWAVDYWTQAGRAFALADAKRVEALLRSAGRRRVDGGDFSAPFLVSEWEAVVEPWGVRSWEQYRDAPRTGRGRPLGGKQRLALWGVFEEVQSELAAAGLLTWAQLCWAVAGELVDQGPAYDHILADECQDLGPPELALVRALARSGPNDVFLTGDSGQQIYKRGFSWLAAGVDVRGRSSRLRLNYRTTEQIRRFADGLLGQAATPKMGADEGQAPGRDSVSLLSGPEPTLYGAETPGEEAAFLATWIEDLLASGFLPQDIGVFGRTKAGLHVVADPALQRAKQIGHPLADDDPPASAHISLGTMHRAKGLEFKAVAVVGCGSESLPLKTALRQVGDPADKDEIVVRERHLLYVACTRARERLLVTWTGESSPFLSPPDSRRG